MKYVQINSFYDGSTGMIMRRLHEELMNQGDDSYIFWGRRHNTINSHEQCCAHKASVYLHGFRTRLTDRMGFYSKSDTKNLLRKLDEINPDVVHIHNIHGYYINIEMLFNWLADHDCKVKWTLHDCWAFTGHCAYFTYVNCSQWKTHCAMNNSCPQLYTYPKTFSRSSCARNFSDKKNLFTMLPAQRMTLITPSHWLESLVKESFLAKYPIEVVHNEVDNKVFRPTPSNFRNQLGIGNRLLILGVASPWTERKGLNEFLKLAQHLDNRCVIVLVGLSKKQKRSLPDNIIGMERTSSQRELAEIYSTADVFFNPTFEDNYPTVNLEAEACGTSVISYQTGGCEETLHLPESVCVPCGRIDLVEDIILKLLERHA